MIWHWTDILISVFVSWVGRKENVHFCNVFFMHSVSVQIKLRQWTEWHLKIPSESWYHLFKCDNVINTPLLCGAYSKCSHFCKWFIDFAGRQSSVAVSFMQLVQLLARLEAVKNVLIHLIASQLVHAITRILHSICNILHKIVRFSNQSFEWIE